MTNKYSFLILILSFFIYGCSSYHFVVQQMDNKDKVEIENSSLPITNTVQEYWQPNIKSFKNNYIITWTYYDSTENEILFLGTQKRSNSENMAFWVYDLEQDKIKWQQIVTKEKTEIEERFNPDFITNERIVFIIYEYGDGDTGYRTIALDRNNGKIIWKRTGIIDALDDSRNLVFKKDSKSISLVDLNSGKNIWKREVEYNPSEYDNYLSADSWLAGADGIHKFDLDDGSGWDVEIDSDAKGGWGKVIGISILNTLAILLNPYHSGTYSTPELDEYTYLTSNLLFSDEDVFCAGNRVLVSVNEEDGKENWRKNFRKIATHSTLFETEKGNLGILAEGWCFINGVYSNYGEPYLAEYDKTTGKELNFVPIESPSAIVDYLLDPEIIYLINANHIFSFNNEFKPLQKVKLEKKSSKPSVLNKLKYFIMPDELNQYFVKDENQSRFINLAASPNDLWIMSDKGILELNDSLKVENFYRLENIFQRVALSDSITFLENYRELEEYDKNRVKKDKILFAHSLKAIMEDDENIYLGDFEFKGDYDYLNNLLFIWQGRNWSVIYPESLGQ